MEGDAGPLAPCDRKAKALGFRVLRESDIEPATEELVAARPREVPMSANGMDGAVEILLVEDNPADARLTREVFEGGRLTTHLNIVHDGEEGWFAPLYVRSPLLARPSARIRRLSNEEAYP